MGALGSGVDRRLDELARQHGFGVGAVSCLHRALEAGGGMAQFSHPELGGLGQWAGGGMVMIGEMGNAALRRRVGALCEAVAALPAGERRRDAAVSAGAGGGDAGVATSRETEARAWWPEGLGWPSSSGAQGEVAYAWFPGARRLAVRQEGRVAVYDTGAHAITGMSQESAGAPVRLHAGKRDIGLAELAQAEGAAGRWTRPGVADAEPGGEAGNRVGQGGDERDGDATERGAGRGGDPIALIEGLARLRAAGVLTEREFAEKKTELLGRV